MRLLGIVIKKKDVGLVGIRLCYSNVKCPVNFVKKFGFELKTAGNGSGYEIENIERKLISEISN